MNIKVLEGQILKSIIKDNNYEQLIFETVDGKKYRMYHDQYCCEKVNIEDVTGDFRDLIGNPILKAEERSNQDNLKDETYHTYGSCTWTFYELATIKGSVTIRWYGSSNGYYSERVSFEEVKD